MVSESILSKISKTQDVSYYIDLGRKSYENYIIHNNECDIDLAISSFERILEIEPDNAEAHYKLASLLWEKGEINIETAIERCYNAIQIAPDSTDARLYLGYFYRASGCLEEAINQFREAAKINFNKSAKPRIALGISIIQKERQSSKDLKEVLSGLGQFVLGVMLLLNDNNSLHLISRSLKEELQIINYKAKGALLEFFNLKISAFKLYDKATASVSRKELFFEKMGDIQKDRKNFLIAADYYRKALSYNVNEKHLYYKVIETLDDEIDTKEIIGYYKVLIDFEPDNHLLHYNLSQYYLEDKNYFGAINVLRKAIELDPENPFYHNSMAYSLVQVDDFDGAINQYHRAISLNPDNTWTSIVCQALGAIYYQAKNNTEAAIMCYQMALNIEPNNIESLVALAEIHYDKGNYDNAIFCYKKALEFDNDNPRAHCNLGFVYWEKGDINDAIKHYQRAIALYPEYDIAYNNLGVAYLDGLKKPSLALKLFEMAMKHNPNYALCYYNKARCLEMLGKNSQAADYYQMALDINTFTNELNPDEIHKRLSKLFNVD